MKLFTYFRSSAAYRVRIALGLKSLEYEPVFVHLRTAQHRAPEYATLNPSRLVPALIEGPNVLTQSLAIIEYLEETYPEPALLPSDPMLRAHTRALAMIVACDIHPVNNLRLLTYLKDELKISKPKVDAWYRHWVTEGFEGLEQMLVKSDATGTFCVGDTPSLADICLVPQVYNALRFDCDLEPFPNIRRIHAACQELPAFSRAAPDAQPDAE